MIPADIREQQAYDCLEAAERHRVSLLAVATRLAGSTEGGMDLFQQTCLNCHDAIQRNGFAGGRYEFYLLTSIKNLHYKEAKERQRMVRWDFSADSDAYYESGNAKTQAVVTAARLTPPEPELDERAELAEQVMSEVKEVFSANDRVVLRLHADGLNARQIAEALGGGDRTWMHRRIKKLKDYLRQQFLQSWQALGE